MITVVLVEDQTLVREGIRSLLALADDIEVVGEAADGLDALPLIAATNPDVVLLDLRNAHGRPRNPAGPRAKPTRGAGPHHLR
jgi:DNA-binding NarL/FixJ family response regulator